MKIDRTTTYNCCLARLVSSPIWVSVPEEAFGALCPGMAALIEVILDNLDSIGRSDPFRHIPCHQDAADSVRDSCEPVQHARPLFRNNGGFVNFIDKAIHGTSRARGISF